MKPETVRLRLAEVASLAGDTCVITGESYVNRSSLVPRSPLRVTTARCLRPAPGLVLMHPRLVCEFHEVEVQAVSPSLAVGETRLKPKFAPSKVTDAAPVPGEFAYQI